MSCCGEREKYGEVKNEQKWDYINLSDFRSTSCLSPLSYGFLILLLIISVTVYAVDLFTCANLIFYNRWSGQVKPVIPFKYTKWIFAACIILSWVLLVYRWQRAIRAMKSGVVAASYLDPLAVRIQSIRMGANGRGWRRFLVFAALTKGRKGAEYVALFTYFSFEAWLRICFAEGPRQVINALTLYSVMRADLVPTGQHAATKGQSPIVQFFVNVQILAGTEKEQAAILFGMLFTLIIWVFSALSLILAFMFYIVFLWHHIREGSLSKYCRRKIDTRLHKIVMNKVNKALDKEGKLRMKQEAKGLGVPKFPEQVNRQPTLPILPDLNIGIPHAISPLSRQTTQTDFSPFESRPATPINKSSANVLPREPTVPNVFSNPLKPVPPSRATTQSTVRSNTTHDEDAPLMASASAMGYGRPGSRNAPSRMDSGASLASSRPPPSQSFSGTSQGTQRSFNSLEPHINTTSGSNTDRSGWTTPESSLSQLQGRKPIPRDMSFNGVGGRSPAPPGLNRRPTQEYEMQVQPQITRTNGPPIHGGYVAFNPNAPNTAGLPRSLAASAGPTPVRNFTLPQRPQNNYVRSNPGVPQRSSTAPIPESHPPNETSNRAYATPWQQPPAGPMAYRPATTGPGGQRAPIPRCF